MHFITQSLLRCVVKGRLPQSRCYLSHLLVPPARSISGDVTFGTNLWFKMSHLKHHSLYSHISKR